MSEINAYPFEKTAIQYFCEDLQFELKDFEQINAWLQGVVLEQEATLGYLNFIFCSDAHLHQINVSYLNHDTFTDIITFPYNYNPVESDIFISIDRIKENAQVFEVAFMDELLRVMVHGVLHLVGFNDKSPEEQQLMREQENHYVDQYKSSTSKAQKS